MATRYEKEAKRLAELPRAARFEELLDFPTDHTFKVIGRAAGFSEALQRVLEGAGRAGACIVERPSAQGNYISLSFTLRVGSGRELDELYLALERLPGLAYVL